MDKRGVGDIGAVVVIIILLVIIASGLIIKVSSRECYSNKDCEKNSYCGSDFSCHLYPIIKETEIIERQNLLFPSIIIALGLVGAAFIFRNKGFPAFFQRKGTGNDAGSHHSAEEQHEDISHEGHHAESYSQGDEHQIIPYYESISESYSSEQEEKEPAEQQKPPKAGKKQRKGGIDGH